MNKAAELLNLEYTKICQQLGDCHLKLKQLNETIANLESQAARLNESYPLLKNLEAAAAKEQSQSSSQTAVNNSEQKLGSSNGLQQLSKL